MSAICPPDNPVIDQKWYAKEMSRLTTVLARDFPTVPGDEVVAALDRATRELAVPARIPNYLSVLVGREARAMLRGERLPGPRNVDTGR